MLMAATRMHLFAKNGNKAMVMKRAVQASLFYSPSRVGGVYTVSKRFNSSRYAHSPSSSVYFIIIIIIFCLFVCFECLH